MSKRSERTGEVVARLQEAERFLKGLRQDQVNDHDPRLEEWGRVTSALFCFAFGELSPHSRGLREVLQRTEADRSLYFYRLSRCLYQARRFLQKQGMPNPELSVIEGGPLPDYVLIRRYEQERIAGRSWWTLFWSHLTFEKYKL